MKERIKIVHVRRTPIIIASFLLLALGITTYIVSYSEYVSKLNGESSGVVDNVVYVNDSESDWYYYMGQNYTYNTDGRLPTTANKNVYNKNNLVEVKITYSGYDSTTDKRGYVSISEQQDTFIYYKYIPVNDNNTSDTSDDYIDIELIENPFTDRPNNTGFNGWITNYVGAEVSYDNDYYIRHAKVPVTYSNNEPNTIDITFEASWTIAKVGYVNSNSNWSTAFSYLESKRLAPMEIFEVVSEPLNMAGYFHSASIRNNGRCGGYYDDSGVLQDDSCRCRNGPCTFYRIITNETYQENGVYYELLDTGMTLVDHDDLEFNVTVTFLNGFNENSNMAGYFKLITIPNGTSRNGYYDSSGNILSGNCNTGSGCQVYELLQYYKDDGTLNIVSLDDEYYYMSTRDTNIVVMNGNMSTVWSSSQNKPFTLTGAYNDTSYGTTWTVSGYSATTTCYNDTGIENLRISAGTGYARTNPATGSSRRALSVNGHNLRIGRGITQNGTYVNFLSITGVTGTNYDSSGELGKYRIIIESGVYNSFAVTGGAKQSGHSNRYVEARAIYGNDYDRVTGNNDDLIVYYCASGSWGDNIHSSSDNLIPAIDTVVKSGSFGTSRYDNTTGLYVGGRYGGVHYAPRRIKVEGGWIYNINGGPLTVTSGKNEINDTYINMTGGEVDTIYGGAGTTTTYGNRILSITGGTVNFSIFGGSNGYDGSSTDGKLTGSSYIYVGGKAFIGSEANVNAGTRRFDAEAGSVFGIGNGKSGTSSIGSCDNSYIIIDEKATIRNSVYGGGNYGATGINSSKSTVVTDIIINGGTINGSVYGSGNNNGTGSSSKISTVTVEVNDGNILGDVYGGSNELGTVYGSTIVNVYGGTIGGSVYGGGKGGFTNNTQKGTFVTRDVDVTIGKANVAGSPVITNNVYGGSAFGSVNGDTRTTNVSSYNTDVIVNNGVINGSVFGGGEGSDTFVPYVMGNVTVNINNGTINNVFGGNDTSGIPNGTINVYVNNGNVTNVYGGGNLADIRTANVYMKGGTTTNVYGGCNEANATTTNVSLEGATVSNAFGGSNSSGQVNTTNVTLTSGTVTNIYGGNNLGGTSSVTNVSINGGTIDTIYGGGRLASSGTTNVTLSAASPRNVYGGGEEANVTVGTNVTLQGSNVSENIYGGSNKEGTVATSKIVANHGSVDIIFGGNNLGGTTNSTDVTVSWCTVNTVYGGGRLAPVGTTSVKMNGSQATNIYGGGESADVTESTYVLINGVYSNGNVFGGSNTSGTVAKTTIDANVGSMNYIYGGNNLGGTTTETNVNINGIAVLNAIYGGGNQADSGTNNVTINSVAYRVPSIFGGGNAANVGRVNITAVGGDFEYLYGGSNATGEVTESNIVINDGRYDYVYGSNNQGGITQTTNVNINGGTFKKVFGGGNVGDAGNTNVTVKNSTISEELFGGGNQAKVNGNTDVDVISSSINGNVYGGGNFGEVGGSTDVYISSGTIGDSLYAGGNGVTAIVKGSTVLNVDGTTSVTNHVFGGGNAAATGTEETNNSSSVVNIAGATIGKNLYGGANTSVLYGTVLLNVGQDAVTVSGLTPGNIYIGGTVFGGGEANASGSDVYDFTFISVTTGITINIDGNNHTAFDIDGSIFGSGNASTTEGYSYITIKNYGRDDAYQKNISIQRANRVTLDNSVIELVGAKDRTNEYSDVLFTLSRIDELKLLNNSTLYLQTGANLLKKFVSGVIVDGTEQKASVVIADDGTVNKNVNNKVYMYEGKNLNIALDQKVTAYGEVSGMSFFGMYSHDRDGKVYTAVYNTDFENGEEITSSDMYYFNNGSYVLGLHHDHHNIKVDGFYTNFNNEDDLGKIKIDYIEPTPEDSNYYMWVVGEQVATYDITITASKYSTLGTYELPLVNLSSNNTTFSILGFNYNGLDSNVVLTDSENIPRIANSHDEANNVMGLVMKSTNSGWITRGNTTFYTDDRYYEGTIDYVSENSNVAPSLLFYLYHSKNLSETGRMGTATISMVAVTPIDDLNNEVKRININVTLTRAIFSTNEYEGTITAGREYSMFAPSLVNITSKSSFSTYYALFAESETPFYKDGYHRVLASTYNFPANTKITMIDFLSSDKPEYFYYVVTAADNARLQSEYNQYGEVSYELSKFIKMGSSNSNNNYDDAYYNSLYYNDEKNYAEEEFIFIVDFLDAGIEEDVLNKQLVIELRNNENQIITSVLGVQQEALVYNLYANKDGIISVSGQLSSNNIYIGTPVTLNVTTDFIQTAIGSNVIMDTSYFDSQLGIMLTIYDSNGNIVNGASLLGVTFTIGTTTYYPRLDGTTRIKISERVANVSSNIKINTEGSSLPSANYTLKIESFGSPDGIYFGLTSSASTTVDFTVNNSIYGLKVNIDESQLIIDKVTGHTENDNNVMVYNIEYSSGLKNPNLRVALYRRNYSEIYSDQYDLVDLQDYVTNTLTTTNLSKVYLIAKPPLETMSLFMYTKEGLVSGTYKIVFSLYDDNTYIGDVYKYIFIK